MNTTPALRRIDVRRFAARTIPALLMATAKRVPDRVFLRFLDPAAPARPPRELTFAAFRDLAAGAASALRACGVRAGDRVLLLAENSPEWQLIAIGAQLLRAEPAALFSSLAAGPAEEIARRVRPAAVFVSTREQWAKIAPAFAPGDLYAVLSVEPLDPATVPAGTMAITTADALDPWESSLPHHEVEALAAAVGEEDPYLLLFTSGTTGRQKGVRLAQRTIVHAIDAGAGSTGATEHDLGLHLLPFGHVAGHDQFALALAQGHGLLLVASREDLPRALRMGPTYLFSVPLVYERVRTQALEGLARLPGPLRQLLAAGLQAAMRVHVDGAGTGRDRLLAAIARRLLGGKVRKALGGRVRALFSGGAPASEAAFRFFEALGIPLVELYGMSETAGMISSNLLEGPRRPGVAGLVSPDHEVRVAEDGELLVRGPLLFQGYLDAEDDAGAFTADGFFRTGDTATVEPDGMLRVSGRKKHLLVLSTGKKIAPEPVETALSSATPFQGAVLLGEGRPFVAAAVFVAREELSRLAALGKNAAEELLPRARAALAAFSEYEKPKRLLVIPGAPQDFPALITPTLKIRRDALLAHLGGAVAEIYGAA